MSPIQKIGIIMTVGIGLWIFAQWFVSWCKRVDSRTYDPLRDGPVDAAAEVEAAGIRRPLPPNRNMDGAAQADTDLADLERGTKLP